MNFLDRVDVVARKLERFAAGSRSADPLYVSNRSRSQKFRLALLVGTPVLLVGVLVFLASGNFFHSAAPAKTTPVAKPGELTANVLPDIARTYHSDSDSDCEVIEAGVAAQTLSGRVRNDTDHVIHVANLVFDVTDDTGSQLGAVAVQVENIAPHAIAAFHQPLPQHNAQTALVREIHTR